VQSSEVLISALPDSTDCELLVTTGTHDAENIMQIKATVEDGNAEGRKSTIEDEAVNSGGYS
jgi:hypothetical protein